MSYIYRYLVYQYIIIVVCLLIRYYRHLIYHCQFLKIIFLFSSNTMRIMMNHHRPHPRHHHQFVCKFQELVIGKCQSLLFLILHLSNSTTLVIVAITVGTL